jgi:hypothetical protein
MHSSNKTNEKANTSKKILIIARSFVPFHETFGGVIRILKLSKFLKENGYEVFVLAANGEKISYFGKEDELKNLNVTYYNDPLNKYENIHFLNSKKTKTESPKKQNLIKKLKNNIINIGKEIVSELIIPHRSALFINNAFKSAKELIESNNISNVIVTSPPPSLAYLGLKLKNHYKNKINLIVDYRDSWNSIPLYSKKTSLMKYFSEKLEKKVLQKTNHYIYVSRPILDKVVQKYKLFELKNKSTLIMNGQKYDKDDFNENIKKIIKQNKISNKTSNIINNTEKIKIGHFGSIASFYRNPTVLFDFIEKNFKDNFEFHIYGIHNLKKSYSFVKFHDNVPHKKALELMTGMDLLLIMHTQIESSEEMISGKFFDYLASARPILVYGPKRMEATKLVLENNLGYHINLLRNINNNSNNNDEIKKH